MKTLSGLDLCGNSIVGVSQILDTEGNPIGGSAAAGQAFKVYEDTFVSSSTSNGTETDSNGDTIYIQYYTVNGDTHGILNPIVQLFEVDSDNDKYIAVNADIVIDSDDNDITFKFLADENGDVADWADGDKYYKYRIMGIDASLAGSGSGSGDGE